MKTRHPKFVGTKTLTKAASSTGPAETAGASAASVSAEQPDSKVPSAKSWDLYTALFESDITPIIIVDLLDRVVDANPAVERLFGYPLETYRGRKFPGCEGIDDGLWEKWLVACKEGHGVATYETVRRTSAGTLLPVLISISPVRSPHGYLEHILVRYQDISPLKKAEAELRAASDRFREMFENAPLGYQSLDENMRFVDVNTAWLSMTGYAREEIVGRPFEEILGEGQEDVLREQYALFRKKGEMHGVEFEIRRRNGELLRAMFEGRVSRDSTGRFLRSHCMIVDVTEQRRMQEALARSERQNRLLVQNIYEIVSRNLPDGTILYVSPSCFDLMGYSPEELLNRRGSEFVHPGDLAQTWEVVGRAFAAKEPRYIVQSRLRHRDGRYVCTETVGRIFYDESGNPAEIQCLIRDITARQKAETALRESERRLAEAQSIAHLGSFHFNFRTSTFEWSAELFRIAGIQPEEGPPTLDRLKTLIHPDDYAPVAKAIRKTAAEQVPLNVEFRLQRSDGTTRFVQSRGKPATDPNDGSVLIVGVVLDITDRRRLELELIQSHKMESVGTLASGVAHEFNNVLAMIQSAAEIIRTNAGGSPKLQKYTDMLIEATQRGASVARRLSLFARPGPMKLTPLSAVQVVEETAQLLSAAFPKSMTIKVEAPESSPVILGDNATLHQAIMNLAMNAHEAMPNGGVLTITIGVAAGDEVRQRFADAGGDQFVRVSLADTGEGMDEATLARIYDPFFSTKPRTEKTGLGLSVVHGIMEGHGGYIDVESGRGMGTTVHLYFPAVKPEPARTPAVPAIAAAKTGLVLLVEDEPLLLETLSDILQMQGYDVLKAADGQEALELFRAREDEIAVIITDLDMPRMDGRRLINEVRAMNPSVRIVVATGFREDIVHEEDIGGMIDEVLTKPFNATQILRVVAKAGTPASAV